MAQFRDRLEELSTALELSTTELSAREDELMLWEQQLKDIQRDNEVKIRLAKSAAQRQRSMVAVGSAASGDGGNDRLEGIEEGEECSSQEGLPSPRNLKRDLLLQGAASASEGSQSAPSLRPGRPRQRRAPTAEVELLARAVLEEAEVLRHTWSGLAAAAAAGAATGSQGASSPCDALASTAVVPTRPGTASGNVEVTCTAFCWRIWSKIAGPHGQI